MFKLYPRSCFLNDPTRSKTVHDERKTNDKVLSKAIPVQPTTSTNGVPDDSRPTAQVDLTGKLTCINNTYGEGDERNKYITYTANKLIENGFDNWKDILATWQQEGDWQAGALNTANSNGTSDSGLCQLNSAYHSDFIHSEKFKDPYKQIDYCISVAIDARNKKRPIGKVWYGYASKHKHLQKFECTS